MFRCYKLLVFVAVATTLLVSSCNSIPEAIIEKQVSATNLICPMSVGNGLALTKTENESSYVIYYFEGDSNLYRYSNDLVTEDMRVRIVYELLSQADKDPSSRQFIDALNQLHKGLFTIIIHLPVVKWTW